MEEAIKAVPATTEKKPNYSIKTRITLLGALIIPMILGACVPVGVAVAAKGDGPEPIPQSGGGEAGWSNQNSELTFIQCSGCPKVKSGTVNTGGRCFDILGSVEMNLKPGSGGGGSVAGYYAQEKPCVNRSSVNRRR